MYLTLSEHNEKCAPVVPQRWTRSTSFLDEAMSSCHGESTRKREMMLTQKQVRKKTIQLYNIFWSSRIRQTSLSRCCGPVATRDALVAVSVGPICRFCRKPLGRPPHSRVPVWVCDRAVRQTCAKTPLDSCKCRHTASGTCVKPRNRQINGKQMSPTHEKAIYHFKIVDFKWKRQQKIEFPSHAHMISNIPEIKKSSYISKIEIKTQILWELHK